MEGKMKGGESDVIVYPFLLNRKALVRYSYVVLLPNFLTRSLRSLNIISYYYSHFDNFE